MSELRGMRMRSARVWWRRRGRGARAAACGCVVLAALCAAAAWGPLAPPAAVARDERLRFPGAAPHTLAHLLADFSLLPLEPDADPGSWEVEEERGDAWRWRYAVRWGCGARCAGRAAVRAHERSAREHVVSLTLAQCTRPALPLLASAYDETEIRWSVRAEEGGVLVEERARARCGRRGASSCQAALDAHRARHWARLAPAAPAASAAPALPDAHTHDQ